MVSIRVFPGGRGSVVYELAVGDHFFKRARLDFGRVPAGIAGCLGADAALGYLLWRPAFLGFDERRTQLGLTVRYADARPYLLEAVRPRDQRYRSVVEQLHARLARLPKRQVTVNARGNGADERTIAYDASLIPENVFPWLSVDKTDGETGIVRLMVRNETTAEFLLEAAFKPYGLLRDGKGGWTLPAAESRRFMDWLLTVKGIRRGRQTRAGPSARAAGYNNNF